MAFFDKIWSGIRKHDAVTDTVAAQPAMAPVDGRRIIGLSMVKNEQDIIEPFIRHNARFLDCMIILDNASVDETRRIAMDCARELGNVIIADSNEFGYTQSERMTRLLQSCTSAFFADYVVLLDADEFIGAVDRATMLISLERIPPGGIGLLPWQTFLFTPEQADDPPRGLRQRRVKELPQFYKAVLRLDGGCHFDLIIEQGGHGVTKADGGRPPIVQLDDLPMLHFPVRSLAQIIAKGVVGWMAYLAKDPGARGSGTGSQWRDAFDRVVSGGIAPADLSDLSMHYAQGRSSIDWKSDVVAAEPPFTYARRYSTGISSDPLTLIARSWERSLSPQAGLLDLLRPSTASNSPGVTATSFDAAWHWDHLFVDVAPFQFISEKHKPASVLDIGCGIGAYLALFRNLGAADILGLDGVPADAAVLKGNEYISRDLTQPLQLGRMFDLVICTEVAEHLDTEYSDILLDSITRHAVRTIIFSAAEVGQPGHGHINCQRIGYWLERLAARGWYPDLTDSLGVRALATMSWFRRNLVVLQRDDPVAGTEAIAVLTKIGVKPFTWYAQQPGVRQYPFLESLPPPPAGYAS